MARYRNTGLPAPFLGRLWLDLESVPDPDLYPFSLPFLGDGFILDFDRETTVILGENGTGEIDDAPRHRRACRA